MHILDKRELGKSGVYLSPIGISSSFGADQEVYEEAFDSGCNYFTWGTFIRGRSAPFKRFVNRVTSAGNRGDLFIGLLSYSHSSFLGDLFLHSALKQIGTDYIDGLILGYYSRRPPQRVLDWANRLKDKGLVKLIGMTTHNREIVAPLAKEGCIDYFHIRYNAAHRGAERDIFPLLKGAQAGLISFTATCWGKLMKAGKMPEGVTAPSAADCYRYVLSQDAISCCMMGVKDRDMLVANFKGLEKGSMSEVEVMEMQKIGSHLYGKR